MSWKTEMSDQLAQLTATFQDRSGYPAGDNRISEAGAPVDGLPPELARFYAEVGEVSMPDVAIGWFLFPALTPADVAGRDLPVTVDVDDIGDVTTFGSDGGGGLLVLAHATGAVHHLPPGELVTGVWSGGLEPPRLVAATFPEFLDKLLAAVRRFVASGEIVRL